MMHQVKGVASANLSQWTECVMPTDAFMSVLAAQKSKIKKKERKASHNIIFHCDSLQSKENKRQLLPQRTSHYCFYSQHASKHMYNRLEGNVEVRPSVTLSFDSR
jgi:hypothetical protein